MLAGVKRVVIDVRVERWLDRRRDRLPGAA
jgi:hypothetical protein